MGNIYNSCRLPLRMKLAGMLLMGSISMGYGITERRQSASLFIEVNNESIEAKSANVIANMNIVFNFNKSKEIGNTKSGNPIGISPIVLILKSIAKEK